MIAGPPESDVPVPAPVARLASGRRARAVWTNELGGTTFEIDAGVGRDRWFVKWSPVGSGIDLAEEAARMRWAVRFAAVPRVLDHGRDDAGEWLVTESIGGDNAVSPRWTADPRKAVAAIGAGLRALHDTLPVAECPFTWSAADRFADAERRSAAGLVDPRRWHPDHQHLSIGEAMLALADPPGVDQLVVCHGDSCAPNTIIGRDGRWAGHVDLGALGVADRWADLAVATWSTTWNYGKGWERALLEAYGVDADQHRTEYYRLLWDVGP